MPIQYAELEWQTVEDIDIPISKHFGDVYFSKANGLLETRHVFLAGNDLAERLRQLSDHAYFCVAETGFGTGLNFLALWQLWRQVRPNNHSRLHFISTEKYPLHPQDLQRALSVWTELADLPARLLAQYPLALAGCHRLRFDDERISLDLWLGDANHSLSQITGGQAVDAWFLDGFAPSCNPDLWQNTIFNEIIRLSGYASTFASFSVAGVLKRGLQQHGIQISRPKGFGHKREMLKAIDLNPEKQNKFPKTAVPKSVAIIGAGIAGLSVAWTLAQRGIAVKLYEKNTPVSGASGNPYALLNPKLCAMEKIDTHLMMVAWQYAMRFYPQFHAFRPLDIFQFQEKNQADAQQQNQAYADEICQWTTQCTDSPFPAHLLKNSGAIAPHQFAEQVLKHPNITLIQMEISQITPKDNAWQIHTTQNESFDFEKVICCTALAANQLLTQISPLKAIRGQVSWARIQPDAMSPQHAYSYGGYAMMLDAEHCLFGASFLPNRCDQAIEDDDHQHNLQLMQHCLPNLATKLHPNPHEWQGRASLRAQSKDYFPLLGEIKENLFCFVGLGSKGFLYAPLCAEILASQILQEHDPVPPAIIQMLKPLRFKTRSHG